MKYCKITLRRLALLALAVFLLTAAALAADVDEFYAELERNVREQNEYFSIPYDGTPADLGLTQETGLAELLRTMSARSPDGADNADYPALNVSEGSLSWNDGKAVFVLHYLATQAQIDEVDRRAAEIVGSFQLEEEEDVSKVKLLYEYICTHYTYDETLTKFSAYDGLTTGKMVCQGYALLTYKVMWKAGIPCRIITGVSERENHAWNIVRLDGVWYNIDTTWDAVDELGKAMTWDFFLKSPADFKGHARFAPYETEDYRNAHPMAAGSREIQKIIVKSGESELVNLICRVGVPVQLTAVLPEGVEAELRWSSSNPDVVAIDGSGRLEAKRPGESLITVGAAGYRGVISAQANTQAVDLRGASPWAFDAVTDYYLSQLLPGSLCGDFQKDLTRGELARLCYQYVYHQKGWDYILFHARFSDLEGCPDELPVLYCAEAGLMRGLSADTFAPDAPVTREQAATVLHRLVGFVSGEPLWRLEQSFSDSASISPWARDSVNAVAGAALLSGSNGSFYPKEHISREEMIVALQRARVQYPGPKALADAA